MWRAVEAVVPWSWISLGTDRVNAFRKWAHSLGVRIHGELWTEFRPGKIEPPFDQVRDEQRILVEKLQKHGPHNEGIRQAIASFLDELDKPKH